VAPRYWSAAAIRSNSSAGDAINDAASAALAAPALASREKLLPIVGGAAARSALLPAASFGNSSTVATVRLTVPSPTRRSFAAVMRDSLVEESTSRGGSPIPFTPRPRSRDITTASVMAQHVGALGGHLALGAAKARDSLDRKASAGVIDALPQLLPAIAARPSSMQLQPGAPVNLDIKRPTSASTLAGLLTKNAASRGDESVADKVVSVVRATAEERLARLEHRLRSVRRRAAKKVEKKTAAKKAAAVARVKRRGGKPSTAYAGVPFIKPTLRWKRGKAPTYDYKHSV
jgi:hypothetical protein